MLTALCASASDNYLHILTDDGWKILNIEQIDKISFKNGTMTATGQNNETVLAVPSEKIQSMSVLDTNDAQTGIEAVTAAEAPFVLNNGSASVTMLQNGNFRLINLEGMVLCEIPAVEKGQTIDLTNVAPGIHILQSGSFTIKVCLQ